MKKIILTKNPELLSHLEKVAGVVYLPGLWSPESANYIKQAIKAEEERAYQIAVMKGRSIGPSMNILTSSYSTVYEIKRLKDLLGQMPPMASKPFDDEDDCHKSNFIPRPKYSSVSPSNVVRSELRAKRKKRKQ